MSVDERPLLAAAPAPPPGIGTHTLDTAARIAVTIDITSRSSDLPAGDEDEARCYHPLMLARLTTPRVSVQATS